ncbi:hypothetical protein HHK36_015674 [Tetracentron sinense]|uniref:Uncharacterized protein n=1 Tax=Tetracentron sinense TaxID=13715 RepID=A0A834Z7P2_TETSI|nr:hypothetical protein HHK36_015674 [Tetracentron sinense]
MMSRFHVILLETKDLLAGFTIADFLPSLGWINKFNGLEARLQKNFSELDSYYDEIIEERLDPKWPQSGHEYLFDVLLRVQKDPTQAITLTRDQIKGVLTVCVFPYTPFPWFGTLFGSNLGHLPNLLIHLFNDSSLRSFGSIIGKVLKLDDPTKVCSRPSMARVCIEVDLLKNNPERFWLGIGDHGR